MRLRAFRVVRAGGDIDEVADLQNLRVTLDLGALARGGQGDLQSGLADPLEQRADTGERSNLGQVLLLEQVRAVRFDHVPFTVDPLLRQEDGHQLVAALADLAADLRRVGLHAEMRERFHPGACVQIDAVEQGPVDVENHRAHRSLIAVHGARISAINRAETGLFRR
jgi:hypothetical protein